MQLPQRQSYFYLEGKYSHENRKARFFFDRHLCVRFSLQCFGWKKHLRRITGPAEQFLICGVPLYLHLFVHFSKSGGALGPPAPPPAWALLLFTLPAEPFLLLLGFGTLEKTLRDRVRSLLSMRSVLLGYRPNSSALGTAGSLVIIGFVIAWNFPALAALASFVNKRMLAFEKKKTVWRDKTELTTPEVRAAANTCFFPPQWRTWQKEALFSQGAYRFAVCRWFLFKHYFKYFIHQLRLYFLPVGGRKPQVPFAYHVWKSWWFYFHQRPRSGEQVSVEARPVCGGAIYIRAKQDRKFSFESVHRKVFESNVRIHVIATVAACEEALHWGYRVSHARAGAKGNARGFTARSRVLARFTPRNGEILRSLLSGCTPFIRELKQRRFWATHLNRECGLFHFKIYWRYQICIS